jgi:DNA-binding NarL/FixJ family response regulator
MRHLKVVKGAPIRLVIVENHQLVADSLAMLLDGQTDIDVVGRAGSVHEAASLPRQLAPDVAILDFHLGDGTGRDAALLLRELYPNVRFVFLSRDGSDEARLSAIEAGASAYLLKSGPSSEVIDTVRQVAEGQSLISPAAIARLVSHGRDREHMRERLSHRELEVLQLMADGVATRQMASRLGISYSTVRSHVRSISAKLETKSMLNTVIAARELELVN